MIAVSIVSHGHGAMIEKLVASLLNCPEVTTIVVTRNIPEKLAVDDGRVVIVDNPAPKGFGANHNAAFAKCGEPYFCVMNPDIELLDNPFPELLAGMSDRDSSIAAPLVLAPTGAIDDSVRYFPTLFSLARKVLGGADGRYKFSGHDRVICPEWVAGMFMLFPSSTYRRLNGFDEKFFLYYEDVDICVRAWKLGIRVVVCTNARVVHDARRDSHRRLPHLRWHLQSMARYFYKHWGRLPAAR